MKLADLFRQPRLSVLGALTLVLLAAIAATQSAFAAGFGEDDRIAKSREKGTVYGAIGLVVHDGAFSSQAGTGFLVSPCHVMTAYHVLAGQRPISTSDTATFYVGQGSDSHYAENSEAHPVIWGNYIDDDDGKIASRVKAIQSNGWNDWVLMKLDRCLGDEEHGWGYLKLAPQSTRALARSGTTLAAIGVGLPKDKSDKALTEDPNCRVIGQMAESGWQHDCMTLPGNSGGPILERNPEHPGDWPRALGINVSIILLDGLDPEAAESAVISADDPSYFTLLSNAVPVSAFINKVAQYLPEDPEIAAYIARQSLDIGYSQGDDLDHDGSIADLGAALKAKPKDAELYLRRGLWLASAGKTDAAIEDYTKALELRPNYPAALLSRSQSFSERDDNAKGDLKKAIGDLTALIDRFQDSAELIMSRGYFFMRDREFEQAVDDFTAFLRLRPESGAAMRARAAAYSDLKQYDQAASDYDRSVGLDPDLPVAYIARGNFHSSLGRDAEALADFDRAITLYPAASTAYSGRAYVLLQQGDYKGAIRSFDQAVKYDDKASYALGGRASVYQVIGDHDASLRDYRDAVDLDPGEPFIQLLYFVEQLHAGKTDEAKKNFAAFAADGRYEDWPRALAQFFAGEIDVAAIERMAAEATTDFDKMARAFDRDFYLGQAALIAGDNAEAEKRLNAVVATGERQYIEYNIAAAEVAKLKGIAQTSAPAATTTQN